MPLEKSRLSVSLLITEKDAISEAFEEDVIRASK